MIKNKFINTTRSISFNFKNNKFKKNRIKHPYIWFLTDNKKIKYPLKVLKKLPKKSGVIIRDYKNKKIVETFLVNGGIVEVSKNRCTLLSEDIIRTSDYKGEKTDDKIETEKIRVSKKLYYS